LYEEKQQVDGGHKKSWKEGRGEKNEALKLVQGEESKKGGPKGEDRSSGEVKNAG